MAAELVQGFTAQMGSVTLLPSSGGIFEVRAAGDVVYSKEDTDRFPEEDEVGKLLKEKQLLE